MAATLYTLEAWLVSGTSLQIPYIKEINSTINAVPHYTSAALSLSIS
jgi:hypothetical protein